MEDLSKNNNENTTVLFTPKFLENVLSYLNLGFKGVKGRETFKKMFTKFVGILIDSHEIFHLEFLLAILEKHSNPYFSMNEKEIIESNEHFSEKIFDSIKKWPIEAKTIVVKCLTVLLRNRTSYQEFFSSNARRTLYDHLQMLLEYIQPVRSDIEMACLEFIKLALSVQKLRTL